MNPTLYDLGWKGMLVAAAAAFVFLHRFTAPYGRHHRPGWGPALPARTGWFVMEAVSPLVFTAAWWEAGRAAPGLLVLWWLHYGYRAFVYPFRMRGGGKPMPWVTAASAVVFNVWNGSINGYAAGASTAEGWLPLGADPRTFAGLALFATGAAVNHWADARLRALRGPGETGYAIPRGGLFRWVGCPNYLGEIVEWLGFALLAGHAAGWAFAAFTFANLAPRARRHNAWYRETFPEYPRARRALIPFLY